MEMLIGGIGISQQITSPTYKRGNHNLFLHQGSVGLAIATVITRMLFFRTRKGPEEKKRLRTMLSTIITPQLLAMLGRFHLHGDLEQCRLERVRPGSGEAGPPLLS
ncbi:hypothetical protein FOXYSP1_07246 [Fusarium oxysporum f. sp. phaseoli]